MPVSHLGLTVSHIPSATSFYLSALQPLGYRYIGKDGATIGLGVDTADLFLTQEPRGARVTPSHVAFCADSRLTVRNCYASALHAGGHPSGPPAYANEQETVFNAAVEDLDGNTIEFIFHESSARGDHEPSSPLNGSEDEYARVSPRRRRNASDSYRGSPPTATSAAASSQRNIASTAILGTIFGAAAGAAMVYATRKSDRGQVDDEGAFRSSTRQRARRNSEEEVHVIQQSPSRLCRSPHRAKSSHRNYSVTETTYEPRRGGGFPRAIEAGVRQDDEVTAAISRHRASQQPSVSGKRSSRMDGGSSVRSSGSERKSYVHAPPRAASPDRASRSDRPRGYYLEAVPVGPSITSSYRRVSRHSHSEASDDERRDSGVSVHSSRHSRSSRHSSTRRAKSTRAASSHHNSAADIPLPPSRTASSYHNSAADIPLPPSRSTSYFSAAQYALPESHSGHSRVDNSDDSDGLSDSGTVVPEDSISCVGLPPPRRRRSKKSHERSSRHSVRSEDVVREVEQPHHRSTGSRHSAAFSLPVRTRSSHPDRHERRSEKRSVAAYA